MKGTQLGLYGLSDVLLVEAPDSPYATVAAITTDPANGSDYRAGETIKATVTFSEAVTVTGTPQLPLRIGDNVRDADYVAGDSSDTVLSFSYPVTADDFDQDGISIDAFVLKLNGDSIKRKDTTVDAALTHTRVAAARGQRVSRPARVQTTLVSNLGQTDVSSDTLTDSVSPNAQQFETGSNPGGYTLTEIVVNIRDARTGSPAFALHTSTSDDKLDTKVVELSGDSSTAGEQSFTPDSATTLSASTKYYIVFRMTSGTANLQRTSSNNIDSGASPGWDIAENSLFFSGTTWTTSSDSVEIAINGTATAVVSTDATLSDLVVNDGGADLTLTPTFASGTTTYTASVVSTVTEITVMPTLGDPVATIEYLDGSDATLTDADTAKDEFQMKVAEGDNVIKVKVTAADGNATQTYMVTVNRAAPAVVPAAATRTPTISGTPQAGETLTADTSGIGDADGLENVTFSYHWLAGDSDISGATGSAYTLIEADEGKAITVQVSFTDDAGNDESLTSAATDAVAAKPNSPATGAPTISGTAQVGETLTADTSGIADVDGLENVTFSYHWLAGDSDISGATGSAYTLADADEGNTVKIRVSFTDDGGNDETLTSAATEAVAGNQEPVASEDVAVWSAIMTAEWVYQGYGYYSAHAKKAGSLSPASFEVDGTTYTVKMVETQGWWTYIGVDRELPFDFVLELDGVRFASGDASFNSYSYGNIYRWERTGLR